MVVTNDFCEGAALVEGPNGKTLNTKTTLRPSLVIHSQAIKITVRRAASHHWEGDKARCEWLEWTTPIIFVGFVNATPKRRKNLDGAPAQKRDT